MEIKVPTKFKRIDTSQLTAADVDALLMFYEEIGKIVKAPFLPKPPPVREELIKILGITVTCETDERK